MPGFRRSNAGGIDFAKPSPGNAPVASGATNHPEESPPNSQSARRVIDLIVQTSGVELFRAYGIAAAPMPPVTLDSCELVDDTRASMIKFTGPAFRGVLALCVPEATLQRTTRERMSVERQRDWIQELCNQLLGRIKNRLVRYQVALQSGVPSVLTASALRRIPRQSTDLAYVFRTMTGSIVVWLTGDFDRTSLVFTAAVDVVGEGDVLLF
jgi:hypothetical protein